MMYGTNSAPLLADWQTLVGAWSEAMLRVCLSGTLVLVCALLLMRLLRRVPAGVRCWIGRLAILKLYVLFVCFAVIALPVLPPQFDAKVDFVPLTVGRSAGRDGQSIPLTPQTAPMSAADSLSTPLVDSSVIAGVLGGVPGILLGLWGIGVLFGIARLYRQYREATALVRSACPIADPAIQTEFLHVKNRLGLRCNPVLAVSDLTEVPLLFGLLRPTVVLPSAIVAEFAPEVCRVILAHELAHVKRQDLLWSFLTGLALVPFFYHPLVWWTHRELRMVQEICCDEQAIQSIAVSPHAYGEVLVRVAASETSSTHNGLISVAMAESFTTIQRRLEEMQTFRVRTGLQRWAPAIAVVALGAAMLPWQLKAQTKEDPQAQSKPVPLAQSKEPQQKDGDYRSIKVGVYGLNVIDAAIADSGHIPGFEGVFGTGTGVNQVFKANQVFLVDIEGRNQEDLQLVKGIVNVRSQDDRGKALIPPGTPTFLFAPPMRRSMPNLPLQRVRPVKREPPFQIMLPFEREEGGKSLKTLEGDLLVVNGVVRTLTFTAAELEKGAMKQAGAVSMTLDGVHQTNGHYEIFATCYCVQFDAGPGHHIPIGPMGMNSDLQVEVIGNDGLPYDNVGTGTGGVPRVGIPVPPGIGANAKAGGLNPKTLQVKLTFGTEETPTRPQNVTFHIIEPQGEPFQVPFKFTDVPMAEKH